MESDRSEFVDDGADDVVGEAAGVGQGDRGAPTGARFPDPRTPTVTQ